MLKRISVCVMFMFVMTGLAVNCAAEKSGWRHWESGVVTEDVYLEGNFNRVGIDNIEYTFMPGARVWKVKRQYRGSFIELPAKFQNIYKHQKVEMLVQGFRIYQLRLMP